MSAKSKLEKEKLFELSTNLHLTLDWQKNHKIIKDLLDKVSPGMELAIYWSQHGEKSYFTQGAEKIFGEYLNSLKRVDISRSEELTELETIKDTYVKGIFLDNHFLGMLLINITNSDISLDFTKKIIDILLVQLTLAKYATEMSEEVEKRTSTDKLTGLWNRVYFNERFREECDRLARSKERGSVAIMAFDDLSAMVRMMTGDENNNILAKAGRTVRQLVRKTDWVVRWDKHEILFYFPNTQPEFAIEVFSRCINQLIKTHALLSPVIGLCSTSETTSARALIQLAARRLDLARKDGRKRVLCYASKSSGLKFWSPPENETTG